MKTVNSTEIFKDSPADIDFNTGFHDYETLMLGRPRKRSCFEEFILVLVKLRLALFSPGFVQVMENLESHGI